MTEPTDETYMHPFDPRRKRNKQLSVDAEQDFWSITHKWIDAVLKRYENATSGSLNQVFARGPFAGWSEREVYELAKRMHKSTTDFPLW